MEVFIQYYYFDKYLTSVSVITVVNSAFMTLFALSTMAKFISL